MIYQLLLWYNLNRVLFIKTNILLYGKRLTLWIEIFMQLLIVIWACWFCLSSRFCCSSVRVIFVCFWLFIVCVLPWVPENTRFPVKKTCRPAADKAPRHTREKNLWYPGYVCVFFLLLFCRCFQLYYVVGSSGCGSPRIQCCTIPCKFSSGRCVG